MALRERRFRRKRLTDKVPQAITDQIAAETQALLERRFQKLAVDFDSIEKTNFNPFLLLITAPVYNLFSPFEIADRLQLGKAYHGDDTAFGRFGEEKLLPLFGVTCASEKSHMKAGWEPIDCSIEVEGVRYLMNIKSGPWTINQAHANAMIDKFPAIRKSTGANIMIGIMYGRYENLNNKPGLVEQAIGSPEWFDCLVGRDFWEFISGVKDVHKYIFNAIKKGQLEFAAQHKDETFQEKLVSNRLKIAASLRKAFNVMEEEDFWGTLFNNMF